MTRASNVSPNTWKLAVPWYFSAMSEITLVP